MIKKDMLKETETLFLCNLRPVKQLSSEVVVGAQCGSAVLRGAHVFHPGIIASPKCEKFAHILLYLLSLFIFCEDSSPILTQS